MNAADPNSAEGASGEVAISDFATSAGQSLSLDAAAVGAPAKAAASVSADIIAAVFAITEGRQLETPKPIAGQTMLVQLGMPTITSEQRHELYRTWLLAKGFHDILKGLRRSFEEAHRLGVYAG